MNNEPSIIHVHSMNTLKSPATIASGVVRAQAA